MCGRYSLATPADELIETFDVPGLTFEHEARYNIAPGQDAPVVAEDRRGRRIGLLRWGFVPAWSDEAGSGFANARGESVGQTPSFRDAFRDRRCLVPADGFYEWRREGSARIPYWFHPAGGGVLAMAGIWEHWSRPGQEDRWSFAVLTVDANPDVRAVHDRMPLLLPRAAWDAWLDRSTGPDALGQLVVPSEAGTLASHRVSTRVNSSAEEGADLVEPV